MLERNATRRLEALLAAALATAMLASCSGGKTGGTAATPSDDTLAALVARSGDLSVVSSTLEDAGLSQVFEGVAAYTLLAPRDAAFDSLGEAGKTLRSPEQRPTMVAVLRAHIVPGYLTPADIANAVKLDADGKVAMKTMGGQTLTFTDKNGTITATGADGASVHFAGDALLASNGVAIPVDGLVVKVDDAVAAQQ